MIILDDLPNGLHDAYLAGLQIDYASEHARAVLRIDVDLSDANGRCGRRIGRMIFDHIAYVALDPPVRRFRLDDPMEVHYKPGGQPDAGLGFGPEYALHTFYLAPLNAYLRVAATGFRFEWEP